MIADPSSDQSKKHARGAANNGARRAARTRKPRRGKPSPPQRLIDSEGPAPNANVADVRLTIGKIIGTHGLDGEVRMAVLTDQRDHLEELTTVFLGDDERTARLRHVRFHGDTALVSFEGINTVEDAQSMRGLTVKIPGTDARQLEDGEYFVYQLIGLVASTPDGEKLGIVVDLIETGAHDVLVIAPEGAPASRSPANELLIPNQESYVQDVDPESGTITVNKPVYLHEVNQ